MGAVEKLSNEVNPVPKWPIMVYFACMAFVFTASTLYHTLNPYSQRVHKVLLRLDVASVIILLMGGIYPIFIYASQCHGIFVTLYLPALTLISLMVFYVLVFVEETSPNQTKVLMGVLSLTYFVPLAHLAILEVWFDSLGDPLKFAPILSDILICISLAVAGFVVYLTKFPECFFPAGMFDMAGQSHNLWHILTALSMMATYQLNWNIYYLRRATPCLP